MIARLNTGISLADRDRDIRRLHRVIDRESRMVLKYINSPNYEAWVKVSAQFAAKAAFDLYPELRV